MQSNGQIIRRNANRDENGEPRDLSRGGDFQPTQAFEPQAGNPLLAIHNLLKGSYLILLPLATICALVAGLTLHHMVHDKYSSTGTLHVHPTLPHVLEETAENGPMPNYGGFMEMVATLLTSEQVIDKAVSDPRWEAIAGPASPDTAGAMLSKLKAAHDQGSELVTLSYVDTESKANITPLAVRVVFEAYLKLFSQSDEETRTQTIRKLEDLNVEQSDALTKLDQKSLEIARKYGTVNLEQQVQQKMVELSNLKDEYTKVELALAAVQSIPQSASQPSNQQLTPEAWALSDGEMARLLDERRAAQSALRDKMMTLGENNPALLRAKLDLQDLEHDIEERASLLSSSANASGDPGVNASNGDATGVGVMGSGRLRTLLNQEKAINKMLRDAQEEVDELGRDNIALNDLRIKEAELVRRSAETKQRLEELKLETATAGRIDVISYGDRPALESRKRTLMTAAGSVAGAGFACAGMILFQLVNRRVRHVSDVQIGGSAQGNLPLLGAVPMILEDKPDVDHDAVAFAVHKIRARLEMTATQRDQRILAVTSPAPGNGKTSLVMALGISFAGSGSRTLLVDADIIAGGLTARLNVKIRRNVAEIIRRNTSVSEQQLAHASKVSRSQRSSLLQKLVDFDFLDHESAVRVLNLHKESSVGILDALAGDNLNDCVSTTCWPNMFVLPRGAAMNGHSGYLSPAAFRRLLEQARTSFDIVLVDTGPILGSIEATVATSTADGTILVVSRGGSAGEIRRAASELDATGANVLGVIFNRAKTGDILVSGSSTSYRSQAGPSNGDVMSASGPIATAMVRTSPGANGESHR